MKVSNNKNNNNNKSVYMCLLTRSFWQTCCCWLFISSAYILLLCVKLWTATLKWIILHTWIALKFVTQQALREPVPIYILAEQTDSQGLFVFSSKVKDHSETVKLKCLF